MPLESLIRNGYHESVTGIRQGDTGDELEGIRTCIRAAKTIVVPNRNTVKITVINEVLQEFGLAHANHLDCDTNCCDLTRMPAMTKALMALDTSCCDLVIARGRLGIPGSGSMLVILDPKGRILTAGLSPPHIVHGKQVTDAVRDELVMALERIGFCRTGAMD